MCREAADIQRQMTRMRVGWGRGGTPLSVKFPSQWETVIKVERKRRELINFFVQERALLLGGATRRQCNQPNRCQRRQTVATCVATLVIHLSIFSQRTDQRCEVGETFAELVQSRLVVGNGVGHLSMKHIFQVAQFKITNSISFKFRLILYRSIALLIIYLKSFDSDPI